MTVIIVAIGAWAITFFFAFLFACKGDFGAWWGSLEDLITKCVNTLTLLYAFTISDVVTDIIVLLLPLPMVRVPNLSDDMRKNEDMFTMASIRLQTKIVGSVMITEVLWLTMVEVGLGLLATCLPILRFLFKDLSPDWLLGNMRSIFSFRSTGSQSSKSFASTIHITHSNLSSTSHTYIVGAERLRDPSLEGFEMKEQTRFYNHNPPPGQILVRSSVAWNKEARK
ncbi:hypothetical protein MMC17_000344 [Xylographa soralifera]|nr:hypothetical protein [Xylographa soralifera]